MRISKNKKADDIDWSGMSKILGMIAIIIFLIVLFVIVKQRGASVLGGG